jgi:hypothetical protein
VRDCPEAPKETRRIPENVDGHQTNRYVESHDRQ